METHSTWAALLPVWILGAPLAGAVLEWMRTPKTRTAQRSALDPQPRMAEARPEVRQGARPDPRPDVRPDARHDGGYTGPVTAARPAL